MAELVVALDFGTRQQAVDMARTLLGTVQWMKVGLELFTAEGPPVVADLKSMGFKVFMDMKYFDIPNTVQGAVRSVTRLGADMVNIHVLGGARMAAAALEGADQGAGAGQQPPVILGVTMLTSMGPGDLPVSPGADPSALALDLAKNAKQYGLHGVVCSGRESIRIKAACGPDFLCLTPGIRPASGTGSDDQRRVVTPAQAVAAKSDFLVVGRPITGAPSPLDSARSIVGEMQTPM